MAGSGVGVRVDFHREKIDRTTRGFQGVHPLTRLCLLSSCEERRWPSGQTCIKRLFGLSAHTMRHPAEKDIECAATSFYPRRQKEAKAPLGDIPGPRVILPVLFLGEPPQRYRKNLDKQGTAAPGIKTRGRQTARARACPTDAKCGPRCMARKGCFACRQGISRRFRPKPWRSAGWRPHA